MSTNTTTIRHLEAGIMGAARAWPRTATVIQDGKPRQKNPASYRTWKNENAEKLRALAGYRTFEGEIAVLIDLYETGYTVRIAALEDDRRPATGYTGDIDNYAKAILDALQEAKVITNDSQVAEMTVRFRPEKGTE